MQTLAVNADNELYVGARNSLVMATGNDAVAQTCVRAASTTLTELQYAYDTGVDYLGTVFSYGNDAASLTKISLDENLSRVTGVNSVTDLEVFFDSTTNQLYYSAVVVTDDGIINL